MKEKTPKKKMAMWLKVGVILCLSAAVFFLISIGAGYTQAFLSIRQAVGVSHREMASLISADLTSLLAGEIEALDLLTSGENQVKKTINETADRMRLVLTKRPELAGFSVVDKFGALVASSDSSGGFYYANEEWWKKAFAGGKGSAAIGDPEMDASSGKWCLSFVIPVRDEQGSFLGAVRYLVNLTAFSGLLENFKIGNSGEAALVDDKGYLVFHKQAKPYSNKFCSYEELRKILENENRWFLISSAYLHQGRVVASFSKVKLPALSSDSIKWWVFVIQDEKEVFAILNRLILKILWLGAILTLILLITGLVMGRRFVRPIRVLQDGMLKVGKGELDYRVNIEPGDEIGRLAASFSDMLDNLQSTTTSVAKMNSEIEKKDENIKRLTQMRSGLISAVTQLKGAVSAANKSLRTALDSKEGQFNLSDKSRLEGSLNDMEKLYQGMDNILDVAKIDAGEISLNIAPVDIKEVMREIIFFFEPKVRSKGLDFRLDLPKGKTDVLADQVRIKEVFHYLIENALKFTEKGYVGVSIKDLKNEIECSVMDSGTGIGKEDVSKIFDRAQDSKSGMNLFLTKSIIELHSGRIWVESESGKWTKFTFKLPKNKPA